MQYSRLTRQKLSNGTAYVMVLSLLLALLLPCSAIAFADAGSHHATFDVLSDDSAPSADCPAKPCTALEASPPEGTQAAITHNRLSAVLPVSISSFEVAPAPAGREHQPLPDNTSLPAFPPDLEYRVLRI